MSKKSCCCIPSDSYIAVPCRSYSIGGGLFGFTPNELGIVEPKPTRRINGQDVFDSTRKIVFMMRGGGGGGNIIGKGGNGAYGEYREIASLSLRFRQGIGGTAGQLTQIQATDIPHGGGGQGYVVAGFGGGASVLSSNSTFSGGKKIAGGGGSGKEMNGGHGGTYNGITGSGTYGGGAASQSSPGSAGTTSFNTTSGVISKGGRGAFTSPPLIGHGGGGGGGERGGGGGGATYQQGLLTVINGGGGGGGSSTITSTGTNFIEGTDDGPGAMCNPYFFDRFYGVPGLGGNRTTKGGISNPPGPGYGGGILYYFLNSYCLCDGENSDNIPEKMFLCLSKDQYDYIINSAGPPPEEQQDLGLYVVHFTFNEEKYILLGETCSEICEPNFKASGNASDVYWSVADDTTFVGPSCCEVIRCYEYCSTTESCDSCCDITKPSYYCCENTQDKPNEYWSLLDDTLYKCIKTNAWVPFGDTSFTHGPCPEGGGFGAGCGGFGGTVEPESVYSWGTPGCLGVLTTSTEDAVALCAPDLPPKACNTTISSVPFGFEIPPIPINAEWSGSCCVPEFLYTIYCGVEFEYIMRWKNEPFGGRTGDLSSTGYGEIYALPQQREGSPKLAISVTISCATSGGAGFGGSSLSACGAVVTCIDENGNPGGNWCSVFAAALQSLLPGGNVTVFGAGDIHSSEVNGPAVVTENGNSKTFSWYTSGLEWFLVAGGQIRACFPNPLIFNEVSIPLGQFLTGEIPSFTLPNPCCVENCVVEYKEGTFDCQVENFEVPGGYEIIQVPQICKPEYFWVDDCTTTCTTDPCAWTLKGTPA
jgi:hypothetical protein